MKDDDARQPVITRPWVRRESSITLTQVIFGANVAVFLAMALPVELAPSSSKQFSRRSPSISAPTIGPLTLSGELVAIVDLHVPSWRPDSHRIQHVVSLGSGCDSASRSMAVDFRSHISDHGPGGGVASMAWDPGVLSVGASGAIFGLAGALIASFYLGEFSLPRVAISGTLRSLLFFAGFNLTFRQFMSRHRQ